MTATDLSVLRPADRELVEEALAIFGGEVVAITTAPMEQVMLPLTRVAAPKQKPTRRRKAQQ